MSKYHAQPLVLDNIRFASTKEAHRYQELKLLERAGEISHLELQPVYPLGMNGILLGKYVADFRYLTRTGAAVVEDVKSTPTMTPIWRWKTRHLKAQYGIDVVTT